MKKSITHVFFTAILLMVLFNSSNAQVSSKIMDASINWTPSGSLYSGQVSVYLTDTLGLNGLKIQIGSQPDDSDLYQANYTIGFGGSFYSNGTSSNNVLQTNIGTFSSHPNYYAKISVLLTNGLKNEIAVHSSN